MSWWRRALAAWRRRRLAADAAEARAEHVSAQDPMVARAARDLAKLPPDELAARIAAALRVRAPHPLVQHIDKRLRREPEEEGPPCPD